MVRSGDGATGSAGSLRARELLVACVEATGVDGAGLSLVRHGVSEPVLGTDEVADALELAQFTLGEGPCVDAAAYGVPVLVSDLEHLGEGHAGRWPVFTPEALALGVRAVFAFPLRFGAVSIGAADLYRGQPASLDDTGLSQALTAMDAVALTFLDEDNGLQAESPAPVPLRSLEVHRAAGMVMVQLGVSIDQALARLRATAFAEEISVEALAREVVSRRRRFEERN